MKREIKFRGTCRSTGEWVYGLPKESTITAGSYYISQFLRQKNKIGKIDVFIAAESLGQFTGLFDKNGKEIYEGDIVQEARCKHVSTVVFLDGMYQLQHEHRGQDGNVLGVYQQPLGFLVDPVEVLGNIYEDSGLLKQ